MTEVALQAALKAYGRSIGYSHMERMRWALEAAEGARSSRIEPSDVAEQVRNVVRERHAACEPAACPLSRIWVFEVQEILDEARRLAPDVAEACSMSTRELDPSTWREL